MMFWPAPIPELPAGATPCWAHRASCTFPDNDCPALNTVLGDPCNMAGTGRLGLCELHEAELLGSPQPA